jgi:glycosyltransferase involved in cell wall biosynthesis
LKNILILEDSSKAGFGGGQRVSLDVINSLIHEHSIYIFDCSNSSLFFKKTQELNIQTIKLNCSSKVTKSLLIKFVDTFKSIFLIISNLFSIYSFIKKNNIYNNCIIYATTKKGLVLAFFFKKICNIDFIYHAHMIESKNIKKLVKYLTQDAYKIICVSMKVQEQFEVKNTKVIYNAVRIENNKVKSIGDKNRFVIATISSLNYIKGIEYFIESYQFLERNNITYHIYGDGPLKKDLETNFHRNILIKGQREDIKKILSDEIDILVVPTIIPEAFGMVILEAFSCGVPVITTNIGMQKILIDDSQAGELVTAKNSQEIAKAIDSILNDKDKYIIYSEKGLEYAKRFDLKKFADNIKKVFEDYDITNK